jgi:nickel/cobalt transporter (NicO) family protein
MRRLVLAVTFMLVVAVAAPAGAMAHPLGNFSINHLARVQVSSDRVQIGYILDQAEIPTFQERGLGRSVVLRRKIAEARRGLDLEIDGHRVPLRVVGTPTVSFPRGAGGLATTRVQLSLEAPARHARQAVLRDRTFPGRVGWKAIVAAPAAGTAVRTAAPTGDPTGGLGTYPQGVLDDPANRREARFSVARGTGTVVAPRTEGARPEELSLARYAAGGEGRRGGTEVRPDGLAGLFEDAAAGRGVLALLLLGAFGWGALHALSPGHGKAMVAAYLIGTRGNARDAVALGATVTVTHTIGVFALGLVTLALSQYVLPEQLYPWLTLVSGLMVVAVGGSVLRSRLKHRRHDHSHHHHDHQHHDHQHGDHQHGDPLSRRGVLSMGAAAGLLPCPSALVVLLAAISQHEVALGMLLIVAFSVGLAGTLSGLGLVVVHARRFVPPRVAASRVARLLPALSAVFVVVLGLVLAARAVPNVM